MSYIDSSRRFCVWRWCQDVYHRRPHHRVRHSGKCGLWRDSVGDEFILTVIATAAYTGGGGVAMNPCELTAAVTALANAIAKSCTVDELNLIGVTLTQLGDTLITIATHKSICCGDSEQEKA